MNKLRRSVEIRYIPGDPPVPPVPPVCTTTTKQVKVGGRSGLSQGGSGGSGGLDFVAVEDLSGSSTAGWFPVYGAVPPDPLTGVTTGIVGYARARSGGGSPPQYQTVTETTCTGGAPGTPGTPGRIERESTGPDWTAKAISIERKSGDWAISFDLNDSPRVVASLSTINNDPQNLPFLDVGHGVLFRQAGGATLVVPLVRTNEEPPAGYYNPGDRVALIRSGGWFRIQVAGKVVYSQKMASPGLSDHIGFRLLGYLYSSEDFIENPRWGTAPASGSVRGTTGFTVSLGSANAGVAGSVGVGGLVGTLVDGVALVQAAGSVGFDGTVSLVDASQTAVSGSVGFYGNPMLLAEWEHTQLALPAMAMVAADAPYSRIIGTLEPLNLLALAGVPSEDVAGVGTSLPLFGFYALSHTGELLTLEQELPSLAGMASDRPYGQAQLTLPTPQMYADDGFTFPGYTIHIENLNLRDVVLPDPTVIASIQFGLELEPTLSLGTLVQGSFFEGLILDPLLSIDAYIHALIQSGVNLSSATQAPKEGFGQYGFDLGTAAATRYEGFDFRGFAFTGTDTYAFRKGGIYRLRAGDDDGELRSALVDFGVTGMGAVGKKHIETVYLGMGTDGRVYLKLTGDGAPEKTYRVIQRDPTYRVLTGRGLTAREWGAKLEVVDSSEIELEEVEFVVAASGRKWVR